MKKICLKYTLLAFIIASLLSLISCSTIEEDFSTLGNIFETTRNKQTDEEVHTTLEELILAVCELSTDEAIEQHFNRYYHVTGTVKQIGNVNETNMIILDGPKFAGSDYGVTFFFDGSDSIDTLRELQEGDSVTIRGYLDGSDYKVLVRFDFYHCSVNRTT